MRIVADSHAIFWYVSGSARLSEHGRSVLSVAERERAIAVSFATFLDLWYVTQTTQGVTTAELDDLKQRLVSSDGVELRPIDDAVVERFTAIDRSLIADPWDRLIVATALALSVPLVTRDTRIRKSGIIETIW